MIEYLLSLVAGLSPELATFFLAMTPVGEIRLALPIGITVFDLHPATAFTYAYLGNVIPLLLVFAFLPTLIHRAADKWPGIQKMPDDYFLYLEKKYKNRYDRYGRWVLLIFVALPIPGSGVWTASILAVLFGIEWNYSIPAILIGLAISAGLVLLITQGTLGIFSFLL